MNVCVCVCVYSSRPHRPTNKLQLSHDSLVFQLHNTFKWTSSVCIIRVKIVDIFLWYADANCMDLSCSRFSFSVYWRREDLIKITSLNLQVDIMSKYSSIHPFSKLQIFFRVMGDLEAIAADFVQEGCKSVITIMGLQKLASLYPAFHLCTEIRCLHVALRSTSWNPEDDRRH